MRGARKDPIVGTKALWQTHADIFVTRINKVNKGEKKVEKGEKKVKNTVKNIFSPFEKGEKR